MKEQLLDLIHDIDNIKLHFHIKGRNSGPKVNTIYDTIEFATWKKEIEFELNDIHNRTKDTFIWDTLIILKQKFNGWTDETSFNNLAASLRTIGKNIDKYYSEENFTNQKLSGGYTMLGKKTKVFISHSTLDKSYVSILVELLDSIGLNEEQIFCSSAPGYGIPLGKDIYDYLREQFKTYDLYVIIVLSDNYYNSPACMNEMGAAWALQNKYDIVLLPGFEFKEIKGAISPQKIGLKLDNDIIDLKEKLGQLKEGILTEFNLNKITDINWEKKRDNFINQISKLNAKNILSDTAQLLLRTACSDSEGTIVKITTLSGVSISVGKINFIKSQERREVAKWEDSLNELLKLEYVQVNRNADEIFKVSQKGYNYIDQLHLS
ncbi:toll/interleukin-1 receptor domain-containing protein [uncultured Clostridium sp.]|uniref:toll/interleukin-1 receptor domain-containing protein n=1 Tax=uncultured Clostridium sp. TaxID=59620 RepID=UPI0028E67802|nr:toll/interleukin-1 receptor domain-containing protein [uncultured Clostridium sp.]